VSSLTYEVAFKLRERSQDVEKEFATRRGGIDIVLETFETDPTAIQCLHALNEMLEAAPQTVQLPHDQRIASPQRLANSLQTGAFLRSARGPVLIEVNGFDPGRQERIALQIQRLRPIRLRYPPERTFA
jgi:hypothetical protein